jgi:four helix bundle protein
MKEPPTKMRSFEDLLAWQACRDVRRFISQLVKEFPGEERYRLADQIIRSSRATTALLAEGYGRYHFKENIQYCRQSRGELYEVLDHLIVARDDDLISDEGYVEARRLVQRAVELVNGYIRFLLSQERQAKAPNQPRNGSKEGTATPLARDHSLTLPESTLSESSFSESTLSDLRAEREAS